ncbi:MAG TPA: PaaI family thioesterase [Vicinamibacterales bacterium]
MLNEPPAFEVAVRESFARQTMMASMGVSIARIAPGEVDLEMPYAPAFCQQNGYLHAGATASLADSANGYAALTLAPAGSDVLAVEFKINLLSPARGDHFIARGRVVRAGRTLTVCLAEVHAREGEKETLIATMLSTNVIRQVAAP